MVTYIVATIAPRGEVADCKKSISEYPPIPTYPSHSTIPPLLLNNDEAIEVVRPRPGMNKPQLHLSQGQANVETDVIENKKRAPTHGKSPSFSKNSAFHIIRNSSISAS